MQSQSDSVNGKKVHSWNVWKACSVFFHSLKCLHWFSLYLAINSFIRCSNGTNDHCIYLIHCITIRHTFVYMYIHEWQFPQINFSCIWTIKDKEGHAYPGVDVTIKIFCDFRPFSAKKLAFFSKQTLWSTLHMHNLAVFWAKNANCFRDFVMWKYFKNHNIDPPGHKIIPWRIEYKIAPGKWNLSSDNKAAI
jgi:hypothetical protein